MPWEERRTIYYGRSVCPMQTKRNIASLKNDSKNTSLTSFTKEQTLTVEDKKDAFITDLYSLAEYCSSGELRDQLIRDRIVVGIRSAALSEKLQLKSAKNPASHMTF